MSDNQSIQIVPYKDEHQAAYKQLNVAWISKHFEMEESDFKALDNPKAYILDRGGCILIALYKGETVGTCALIPMENSVYDYELAKMTVSETTRGKGIGYLLGEAAIEKARELGATAIYLESNSVLKPALKLYQKLGFQEITGHETPYERCDVQMGLELK